jgi:thiol:disulfide interchange protein
MTRLLPALTLTLALVGRVYAGDIATARDLSADGAAASARPLVVLFSASYCGYCTAVKEEFFNHLEDDPRYRGKVTLREVVIDSETPMVDFTGNRLTHREFARENGVVLVPTVRFLDGRGAELARPMVGVVTLDYYGWYLDQRIAAARESLSGAPQTADDNGNTPG